MEIWDAYDEKECLVGLDLIRGQPIPVGLRHLVCEILVRHTDGEYLLMQRHFQKTGYPGYFEATAGGSALKGEAPLDCARRELREETGICSGSLTPIGRYTSKDTFYHLYLCVTDQCKDSVALQEGETIAYRWVSEMEFVAFVNSGDMIGPQKYRYTPYLEKIGYIQP